MTRNLYAVVLEPEDGPREMVLVYARTDAEAIKEVTEALARVDVDVPPEMWALRIADYIETVYTMLDEEVLTL